MPDPVDFGDQPLGLSQQNPQLLALLSALLANQTKTTGTATLTGADGKPISKNAQQVPSLLAQLLTGGPDQIGGITGNYTPGQYGLGGAGSGPVSDSSARGGGIKFSDGGVLMNQYSTPIGWDGQAIKEAGGKGAVTTSDFTTALNDYLGALSKQNAPQTAGPLTGTPAVATPQPAPTPVPAATPFQPVVSQPAPSAPNFSSQLQSGSLTPQQVVAAGGGSAGLTASNNDTASLLALLQARKIAQSGVTLPPAPASGTAAASPSIGAMPASSSASPAAPTQSTFGNPLASAYRTYSPASSTFSLNSLQPNDLSSLGTGAYGGTGLSSATVGDIGAGVGGTSSIGSLPAAPAYDASMGGIGNANSFGGGGGQTVGGGGMSPQMGSALASGISSVGSGLSKMFSPVSLDVAALKPPDLPKSPVFSFTPIQSQV